MNPFVRKSLSILLALSLALGVLAPIPAPAVSAAPQGVLSLAPEAVEAGREVGLCDVVAAVDLQGAKAAILQGVKNRDARIDLAPYGLTVEELSSLFDQVFFENPSLFYLENGYSYVTRTSLFGDRTPYVDRIMPSYYGEFQSSDALTYENAVTQVLEQVIRPDMNDFEKALALHDYLALHCDYDDSLSRYSPYHALVEGSAVCQGYLLAYSDLLNRTGVTNYPAVSQAMNHGWNTVRLDGVWYHVDVTWDSDTDYPDDWVFHNNFLLSDTAISATGQQHQLWSTLHACTDNRYGTSLLSAVQTPFFFPAEGGCYFLLGGALCRSYDIASDAITRQYQTVSNAGGGMAAAFGRYFLPRDARLAYYDGSFYYSDSVNLYRYDLASEETFLHGTYTGGQGYIYGLQADSRGVTAEIRQTPTGQTTDAVRFSAIQTPPALPVLEDLTSDSIRLTTQAGVEYSLDGETWQPGGLFQGLSPNQTYLIYARKAAAEGLLPSEPVLGTVTTPKRAAILDETFSQPVTCPEDQGSFSRTAVLLQGDGVITYRSSNPSAATVDPESGDVTITGVGSAVITASTPETDQYAAGEASYPLIVLDQAAYHRTICPARSFSDLDVSQWYHEGIDYTLDAGLMNGVSPGAFAPSAATTRAMLVTILYRMDGSPRPGRAGFADVAPGAWYANAVNWAASEGIVNGTAAGVFSPDQTITREQIAAILYRYAQYKGLEPNAARSLNRYTDADKISPFARTALAWASDTGLITGRAVDTLAPTGSATRAECATILLRFSALLDDEISMQS